jgi:hypothetical protein
MLFDFFSIRHRFDLRNAVVQLQGFTKQKRAASMRIKKVAVLLFVLALVAQGLVFTTAPVEAKGPRAKSLPQEKLTEGTRLTGTPVKVAAKAVVNFSELARQDATRPAANEVITPQVIHSPISPPEQSAPSETRPSPSQPDEIPGPSLPSPPPNTSFISMADIPKVGTGTIVIPPDTQGAVGLTQIFTTLNNNYVLQDKVTGVQSGAVSMDTFWAGIGASGPFDPRVQYDPYNDRWIVSAVSNAVSANSSVLVGVSQTGNPGGLYFTFRVDYDSTNTNWADFPVMGFNKNWVAIGINSVPQPGPAIANKTFVFDYAQLRAGTLGGTVFSGTDVCATPVVTYSNSENTLYVISHLSSAGATYRLSTITGVPPAAPVYTIGGNMVRPGGGWSQPLNQILPQAAPLAGVSACGATPCPLETQDAFVRANAVFRNNHIYYAQTIGLPAGGLTRTAAQWTKLDTTGAFVDGGRIDDPTATATNGGKWYNYASIAVNKFDEVLVGFSQFASNQHVAAGYVFRSRVLPLTMGDPLIFKAGEDYYNKKFSGTRNRWGDYSAAQVDPVDDTAIWTLQQYAMLRTGTDDGPTGSNSSRWSTWWAKLALAPSAAPATISGVITLPDGSPVPGVVVRLSGQASRTTITNGSGQYRFDAVDTDNFYTVTPTLANHRFSPVERSFSLLGNRTDAVFTATADAIPTANAIDSTEYFIRQQYLDLLGREPDQGGFDYWSGQLNACGANAACLRTRRLDVAAAFFTENEFQRTGSFVFRAYKGLLGRQLTFAEFSVDRTMVVEGPNLDATKLAFATSFVQRPDFVARYQQNTTPVSFVDAAMQSVSIAGELDLGNRAELIALYESGANMNASRALVVRALADHPPFAQAVYNRAFVLTEYFGYLRRDPDQGGYNFWVNVLDTRVPGNYRGMVCAFITSAEYQRRFSSVVTRTNSECSP